MLCLVSDYPELHYNLASLVGSPAARVALALAGVVSPDSVDDWTSLDLIDWMESVECHQYACAFDVLSQ